MKRIPAFTPVDLAILLGLKTSNIGGTGIASIGWRLLYAGTEFVDGYQVDTWVRPEDNDV